MSTRIRYFETSTPGVIQSVKTFQHPTNGARYKVLINEGEKLFSIFEDMSNTEVATGRAANLHQVKIKAKAKLQELGIEFDEVEKRARTPKVTV